MADRVLFQYKQKGYEFQPEKRIKDKVDGGAVFIGKFVGTAPAPLRVGEKYCLKRVTAVDPGSLPYAASRECYDLLDFEGDHLRKILLLSDSASEARDQIQKTGKLDKDFECMVIEPYYYSLQNYFTNCKSETVAKRLDIVKQFALGSEELSKDCNKIAGSGIVAHRDLKWQNGVAESSGGELHIRLIDFATIRLEKVVYNPELDDTCVNGTIKSETYKSIYSLENTSPETVLQEKGYEVSEKTDVYALGMMLASLFMRNNNGKYINPNDIWLKLNGWPTRKDLEAGEIDTRKLANAFKKCRENYDTKPDKIASWIEKDLIFRTGVHTEWEKMDANLLERIQELFCKAIRIEPAKRISRSEFIRELEAIIQQAEIIERAKTDTTRRGVSLYLFNATNIREYRSLYKQEAAKVFQQETADGVVVAGMFMSYANPESTPKVSEYSQALYHALCDTEAELVEEITEMGSSRETGPDMLLYAILEAAKRLRKLGGYYFSGVVHLFAPEVPTDKEMRPMIHAGTQISLDDLREVLEGVGQIGGVNLQAHTIRESDPDVEGQWVCQVINDEPEPTEDQPNRMHGYTFDVSHEALYVKLPNGKKVYVGIIDPEEE